MTNVIAGPWPAPAAPVRERVRGDLVMCDCARHMMAEYKRQCSECDRDLSRARSAAVADPDSNVVSFGHERQRIERRKLEAYLEECDRRRKARRRGQQPVSKQGSGR